MSSHNEDTQALLFCPLLGRSLSASFTCNGSLELVKCFITHPVQTQQTCSQEAKEWRFQISQPGMLSLYHKVGYCLYMSVCTRALWFCQQTAKQVPQAPVFILSCSCTTILSLSCIAFAKFLMGFLSQMPGWEGRAGAQFSHPL